MPEENLYSPLLPGTLINYAAFLLRALSLVVHLKPCYLLYVYSKKSRLQPIISSNASFLSLCLLSPVKHGGKTPSPNHLLEEPTLPSYLPRAAQAPAQPGINDTMTAA